MRTLPSKTTILAALRDIRSKRQEHVLCLSLASDKQLIACRTVFIGTLNSVPIHPREIFAQAIADRAAEIIVAHNHPSGLAIPSDEDVAATKKLVDAGQLLGIPVIDHVIVAKAEHFSFREHGLIFPQGKQGSRGTRT
jgi:DNA repair protein RadC